ncbi:MAG: hypothetical protein AB9917_07370 [Negativicutes bacterium]
MESSIVQIFNNLNEWRKLPNYQLERRLDIFFTLFLKQIIQDKCGQELNDTIIPEFPINTIGIGKFILKNNQPSKGILNNTEDRSKKIDYVMVSKNIASRCAYFVELKTDIKSFGSEQAWVMSYCLNKEFDNNNAEEGMFHYLERLFLKTNQREKYWKLANEMVKAGLLKLNPNEELQKYDKNRYVEQISALFNDPVKIEKRKVIYIVPEIPHNVFKEIGDWPKKYPKEINEFIFISFKEVQKTLKHVDSHPQLAEILAKILENENDNLGKSEN